MNMTIGAMIEVLRALADGKTIQRRATNAGIKLCNLLARFPNNELGGLIAINERWPEHELRSWHDNEGGHFNFTHWEYRTKPSPPKPREFKLRRCSSNDSKNAWVFHPGDLDCPHCETITVREVSRTESET